MSVNPEPSVNVSEYIIKCLYQENYNQVLMSGKPYPSVYVSKTIIKCLCQLNLNQVFMSVKVFLSAKMYNTFQAKALSLCPVKKRKMGPKWVNFKFNSIHLNVNLPAKMYLQISSVMLQQNNTWCLRYSVKFEWRHCQENQYQSIW